MKQFLACVLAFSLTLFSSDRLFACTTVKLQTDKTVYMAKSYDWHMGQGYLIVNKRNVEKTAFLLPLISSGRPAKWKSRFGSLTFNQYGREFPNGGINEAGLSIEVMILTDSEPPAIDERKAVNEAQWIQYQLDKFEKVSDMIKVTENVMEVDKIRVEQQSSPLHYFACDKTGDCASFEYLKGKMVVHHQNTLEAPALTNDTYAKSIAYARPYLAQSKNPEQDSSSKNRFTEAALRSRSFAKSLSPIADAFNTLDAVRLGDMTQWQIVYNLTAGSIDFKTKEHAQVKTVRALSSFDFSCKEPVLAFNLDSDASGDIRDHFLTFTKEDQGKMVDGIIESVFGNFPTSAKTLIKNQAIAYPEQQKCAER